MLFSVLHVFEPVLWLELTGLACISSSFHYYYLLKALIYISSIFSQLLLTNDNIQKSILKHGEEQAISVIFIKVNKKFLVKSYIRQALHQPNSHTDQFQFCNNFSQN